MSVTRKQELSIKKDQLEAQLRLMEGRLEREDDQQARDYLLQELDEALAEVDRLKGLMGKELGQAEG